MGTSVTVQYDELNFTQTVYASSIIVKSLTPILEVYLEKEGGEL